MNKNGIQNRIESSGTPRPVRNINLNLQNEKETEA